MKTIEVDFGLGDRVRVKETGREFQITWMYLVNYESIKYAGKSGTPICSADELELVVPVIEWRSNKRGGFFSDDWQVEPDGTLRFWGYLAANRDTPEEAKALAEATIKLWRGGN